MTRVRRAIAILLVALCLSAIALACLGLTFPSRVPDFLLRASNSVQIGTQVRFERVSGMIGGDSQSFAGIALYRQPPRATSPAGGSITAASMILDFNRPTAVVPFGAALYIVCVSWWWILALGATGLACQLAVWRRIRQRNRLKRGDCLACGYSLVGLAPDVACPERGASGASA